MHLDLKMTRFETKILQNIIHPVQNHYKNSKNNIKCIFLNPFADIFILIVIIFINQCIDVCIEK